MLAPVQPDAINTAIRSIEEVSSRIEETFAEAGHQLGRGHAIFQNLNQALSALSEELSSAQIEGASEALREVAKRLNGLAEALPAESALLGRLGKAANEASELLKPLFKDVQMISIIARSAKIEAASLARDREGFLAFTQEAHELARAVQQSLETCARDQDLLSKAVVTALNRQKDFEQRYQAQLLSAGGDLISAYSGMREQRNKSVHLAELAGASTRKIAEAVGRSIISLQAGDSARQRLEHICHGLGVADDTAPSLMPPAAPEASNAGLLCRLQAMQLKDAQRELEHDIGEIVRALSAILSDAVAVVGQGRSLYGGESSDSASFLARIKEILAQASTLIATCEGAGKSVDDALTVVEDTLGKFRNAIAGLSEAVVDITLIGMNASLRASHLGSKGNAFVVIANELKATADHVSIGAARLKPALDGIEKSANELRALRVHGDPAQLANLEPSILHALREVEAGNARLGGLISRLAEEGAEFEGLMTSASHRMTELGKGAASLPRVATRLEAAAITAQKAALSASDEAVFDDLFARYTMERERDVHRDFLKGFGLTPKAPARAASSSEADDGVLLF
ncbi:chemotaxis protein [Bradyrhizobium sp. STM 3562]|uniref:chemotaxis protein n=1 Tax=Bradyrhizobium sp. STM 3562 TaxID=578924 RepID=UPI00388F440C